jgi:hypothetical protein
MPTSEVDEEGESYLEDDVDAEPCTGALATEVDEDEHHGAKADEMSTMEQGRTKRSPNRSLSGLA